MDIGDRGGWQFPAFTSSNPYDTQDYVTRWRMYVNLYEKSWEARKIIRIPIEDALRKPWIADGIEGRMAISIMNRLRKLKFPDTLKRSLMLERLLGGCLCFWGLESAADEPKTAYHANEGATTRFINAIPISRIARTSWDTDPLSAGYMRPNSFLVNGQDVHVSRCLVFDGEPLFDPYDFALTQFRSNLAGFGPSKLAPIWDDIIKAVGTRQAAYQLIQTNNSIIMAVNDLAGLQGTSSGKQALQKLKEIANNISVYRAALIDGEQTSISQSAASFGSVPELIITFIQVISAASDIPATRFIGQAPGGLNATGQSDLENYYNTIDSFQMQRIAPALYKAYDFLGFAMFPREWPEERKKLEFSFPPLWNMDELKEAERNGKEIDNIFKCWESGLMDDEKAIEELNIKGVFSTHLNANEIRIKEDVADDLAAIDATTEIQQLKNMVHGYRIEFDPHEMALGLEDEQEHLPEVGGDQAKIKQIVTDHLKNDPKYYSKLRADGLMENTAFQHAEIHKKANESATSDINGLPKSTAVHAAMGMYKKGDIRLHGLNIAIENPAGTQRNGIDENGNEWTIVMPHHYGYIKGTTGADGDRLDCFVGPVPESQCICIVDQLNLSTGEFDEHKIIFGFPGIDSAISGYLSAYDDSGPRRIGAATETTLQGFKQWIKKGDHLKPFSPCALEIENDNSDRDSSGKFSSHGGGGGGGRSGGGAVSEAVGTVEKAAVAVVEGAAAII